MFGTNKPENFTLEHTDRTWNQRNSTSRTMNNEINNMLRLACKFDSQ